MTAPARSSVQRLLVGCLLLLVAGWAVVLGRIAFRIRSESGTLAAAQRMVQALEDYHEQTGSFPASLRILPVRVDSGPHPEPPDVLDRFEYLSDGQSYQLKFEANGPVVLRRKAGEPAPGVPAGD